MPGRRPGSAPGTSDVTDAGAAGDIVVTAAGSTWVLDFWGENVWYAAGHGHLLGDQQVVVLDPVVDRARPAPQAPHALVVLVGAEDDSDGGGCVGRWTGPKGLKFEFAARPPQCRFVSRCGGMCRCGVSVPVASRSLFLARWGVPERGEGCPVVD